MITRTQETTLRSVRPIARAVVPKSRKALRTTTNSSLLNGASRMVPPIASTTSRVYTSAIRHNSTSSSSTSTNSGPSSSSNSNSTQAPTRPCPKCQRSIPLPLSPCPNCSTLLPLPADLSLHSLLYLSSPTSTLNVPSELSKLSCNGFDLDKSTLRSNWVRRQRELHPDKYSARGEAKITLARELSGRVNEAYNVLGDELKRAEYILSVHQQGPEETDKITDPMLLSEILEAREELEEASTAEEVLRVREANHDKVEEVIASLHKAFEPNPPDLQEAKDLAVQLRYWRGLEAAAKEKVI